MLTAAVVNTASSALVRTGPGQLVSVLLTGGSDAATVTIYDNTAGSGTVIATLAAAAGATVEWSPALPISCAKGLYATITGTAPSISVAYL